MRRILAMLAAVPLLMAIPTAVLTPVAAAKGPGGGTAPPAAGLIYASDGFVGGVGAVAVRADGAGFAPTCPGNPTHATPLEFVAVRDADGALMWSSGNCEQHVLLTDAATRVVTPKWSPDDSRVAFLGYEPRTPEHPDGYTLYVADVDPGGGGVASLSGLRAVAYLNFAGTFDWGPAGDRFVVSQPNPEHKVSVTDPDAWSPPDLYAVFLDGTKANLTNSTRPEHYPAYSPDGTRIAFVTQTVFRGNVRADVFTMPSAGGAAVQVTSKSNTSASNNRQPVWSPDGGHIAFACAATSSGITHVCRIDSAGRTKAVDLTSQVDTLFSVGAWR